MRPDVDRQNFIWRGADGSELRTHWLSTHYDGVGFPTDRESANAEEQGWAEGGAEGIRQLIEENRKKCGDDAPYLPVGGDMRFPSRHAPRLVQALNARGDLPHLAFATPKEALEAIDWARAPRVDGEFVSTQQGSFSANISLKLDDRRASGELYALEALAVLLRRAPDFEPAWRLHLMNQFHDILCGTICNAALRDAKADFRALWQHLAAIRRALTGGVGDKAYCNALPFAQTVRVDEGMLNLPALGFARASEAIQPAAIETPALPLSFENAWYRARIGAEGFVESLVEAQSGRELVGEGAPFGAITMQLDYGDNWWSLSTVTMNRTTQAYILNRPDPLFREDGRTTLPAIREASVVSADADCVVIRQAGELRFWVTSVPFETTITLSKSAPEIAYHTEFTCEVKQIRLRAAFPVRDLPRARRQIPYALVPTEAGEQATQMLMDASGKDAGLAILNRGTPAGNIEGGIMLLTLFRSAAMEYKCESDLSFNLGRSFALDYAALPHAAERDDLLWKRALAFNTPVIACPYPESAFAPQVEGALLSCLRPAEGGVFLRLYNPLDVPAVARLRLPEGARGACRTDGLGAADESSFTQGREIAIPLGARKVQGILIQL